MTAGLPEILGAAVRLATADFRTDAGCTADDVWRDLGHREWECALRVLEDVSDEHPQPAEFWQCLARAAELMQLERSAAWCRWRGWESLNGTIRASLVLTAPEDGGRRSPVPGAGVLRPMWDIGHRASTGEPALAIARIWVEFATAIAPGQHGSVRLAPLNPPGWRHLVPGDLITMHETALPAGMAEITEVLPPSSPEQ